MPLSGFISPVMTRMIVDLPVRCGHQADPLARSI